MALVLIPINGLLGTSVIVLIPINGYRHYRFFYLFFLPGSYLLVLRTVKFELISKLYIQCIPRFAPENKNHDTKLQ